MLLALFVALRLQPAWTWLGLGRAPPWRVPRLQARRSGAASVAWTDPGSDVDPRDTRGKTAAHRLRRADAFICCLMPGLFRRDGLWDGALVVDLGYGRSPQTTKELAHRVWSLDPTVPILGVEQHPARVADAQPASTELLSFRQGGFSLPLLAGERVRMIRAMNVLREYPEDDARPAVAQLVEQLEPGGVLVDGTCDPLGRVMVAAVHGRDVDGGFVHHGLLFACDLRSCNKLGCLDRQDFEPAIFPPRLPKHLIHRNKPGQPIHAFFEYWTRAALIWSPLSKFGSRQHFVAAAHALAEHVEGIELRRRWLRRGWLFWRAAPYVHYGPELPWSHL